MLYYVLNQTLVKFPIILSGLILVPLLVFQNDARIYYDPNFKLNENFVFMLNRNKTPIEGIATYHLILNTGHYLDLFQTLHVPIFPAI